jgi:hypothetical protein
MLQKADEGLRFLGRTQMYALIERERIDLSAFVQVYREVLRAKPPQWLPMLQAESANRSMEDPRAGADEKAIPRSTVLEVSRAATTGQHFELVWAVYHVKIDQHTLEKERILSKALAVCEYRDAAAGRAEIQELVDRGFTSLKAGPTKGLTPEEYLRGYIKEHHHDVQTWWDYQFYGLGLFDPAPYAKRAEFIDWGESGRTDDGGAKLAHEILAEHEYLRGLERRDLIKEIRGVTWRQLV